MNGRLQRSATATGRFAILALDHVRSFAAAVRPADPDSVAPEFLREAKTRLLSGLGERASAVLVDPVFWSGLPPESRRPTNGAGIVLGIEDGDYHRAAAAPRLLPGWDAERAARMGADAVKISFYYDPDGDSTAPDRFLAEAAAQCRAADMPLFCEPLALNGDPRARRRAVLEGVRRFGESGADVLKVQFPGELRPDAPRGAWEEACREVNDASPVPWTLLSEGSDFRLFSDCLRVACRAGASGFMAGRAVWREAASGEGDMETCSARLDDLRAIAEGEGADWRGKAPVGAARPGEGGK